MIQFSSQKLLRPYRELIYMAVDQPKEQAASFDVLVVVDQKLGSGDEGG
jgi:hypothetical protein